MSRTTKQSERDKNKRDNKRKRSFELLLSLPKGSWEQLQKKIKN